MNLSARRERFRAIINGNQCIHPASVFDPISARIAHDLGFEMGMFAGSTASLTVLGAPDNVVLTLSEFAQQIHRIARAADLSLLVDADHGYGNALNVMRCVQELETAGVSGLTIEDTTLPIPFGSGGAAPLTSLEEGLGKMRAAVAARPLPELCIVGRTSAPKLAGIEETLRRIPAYAQTGVDAIFLVGLTTRDELQAVRKAVKLPLILGSTGAELSDREYLASQGVRIALQGHAPIMAAAQAVHDTLKALRDGTPPKALKGVADAAFMKRVTRADDYAACSRDFLD